MEMRKCPKGHYYDASMYNECPYCQKSDQGSTVPLGSDGDGSTMPLESAAVEDSGVTMAMTDAFNESEPDDGRTVAIIREEKGIDPVVGWLVCTEGTEKGRDYRIHSDNNHIGRSDRMDICIRGDDTISRENHATISFDTVESIFFLSPGEGRALVRLNGKAMFQTTQLAAYDRIVIGRTELCFIPLCSEQFSW